MRLTNYLRWALAPVLLMAAPAFASTDVYACLGSGSININPRMGCPKANTQASLDSISLSGSDLVTFLGSGRVNAGKPTLSTVTVSMAQNPSSNLILRDIYAGKPIGPVVISLYESFSLTPSYTILLNNAIASSWSVSASEGGGGMSESVSFSFSSIAILDVAANRTVTWNVVTNTP